MKTIKQAARNFIEPLFRKVVSGEKTQTRRIINPQPDDSGLHDHDKYPMSVHTDYDMSGFWGTVEETGETKEFKPKYKPGETLYLKEPYAVLDDMILYRYGSDGESAVDTWRNKLFMPEKYARYYIRITDVRAERLQNISYEECRKEGIFVSISDGKGWEHYDWMSRHVPASSWYHTPRLAYEALICKINGNNTWDSNPFVWVYDFKFTNKP